VKYLIFSDVHSNTEALQVLLRWARRKRIDKYVVLGDLVGYAASPNQVVDQVRKLRPLEIVRGNHDKVVAGVEDGRDFNAAALQAATWTHQKLSPVNLAFIKSLPAGPRIVDGRFLMCHGTPFNEDAYMFSDYDAMLAFASFKEDLCFFGHTHVPRAIVQLPDGRIDLINLRGEGTRITLRKGHRYLINPGSIGQPRDRDPRLSFATYDSDRRVVMIQRKDYLMADTQSKILKANLPHILAARLSLGI